MSGQYFTREPASASRPAVCEAVYRGKRLRFVTDAGVFSRGELDQGTRVLLEALPPLWGDVLDLGCGWGAIGVALKCADPALRLTLADVNLRALDLAGRNARDNGAAVELVESDGFAALAGRRFDWVITNPPIRAGKATVYRLLGEAAEHLAPGGGLCLVIRRQQGAESCVRYLQTRFARVEPLKKSGGFWALCAREPLREDA